MVRKASRIMRLVAILFLGRITRRSVHTEPTNQCPAQKFDLDVSVHIMEFFERLGVQVLVRLVWSV